MRQDAVKRFVERWKILENSMQGEPDQGRKDEKSIY